MQETNGTEDKPDPVMTTLIMLPLDGTEPPSSSLVIRSMEHQLMSGPLAVCLQSCCRGNRCGRANLTWTNCDGLFSKPIVIRMLWRATPALAQISTGMGPHRINQALLKSHNVVGQALTKYFQLFPINSFPLSSQRQVPEITRGCLSSGGSLAVLASSGWAVGKLVEDGLLHECLASLQFCCPVYCKWATGRVPWSALCSWDGFVCRKRVLCFWVLIPSVDVAVVVEVIKREWKDPDKIILPRFMAKLYPLQDMAQVLPDSVPIDSFVTSLVGCTSLAEDAVIWDSVDKKVDVSLKKTYAGTHLLLWAGIYGTYVAQSLLSDLKAQNNALDGSSDCSELMSHMECQVEFLSDVSFDVVWASALSEGAYVSARRNLVLSDWETDAAQLASALRLPFQGNVLFGAELEEKLHKLIREKKHSSSFRLTLGDRRLFCRSPCPIHYAPPPSQTAGLRDGGLVVQEECWVPLLEFERRRHKADPSCLKYVRHHIFSWRGRGRWDDKDELGVPGEPVYLALVSGDLRCLVVSIVLGKLVPYPLEVSDNLASLVPNGWDHRCCFPLSELH
ncbi:hypothetical protein NDU88_003302 [Pleurodeles waltl]|uniref:Lamina-associated polypeptide 2 alpha C-terminal domain-containing protein n=1 Tax=Pleurodeles waltl TaxID=8319 RepID=A0AAV7M453_PLEWA|nr:hypothetical protein NDU88_003302 [Pleurodeles waltl]